MFFFFEPTLSSISDGAVLLPTELTKWPALSRQELCTGIAEVMGSNPIEFRLFFLNCDDLTCLFRSFNMWNFIYSLHISFTSILRIHCDDLSLVKQKRNRIFNAFVENWYTNKLFWWNLYSIGFPHIGLFPTRLLYSFILKQGYIQVLIHLLLL